MKKAFTLIELLVVIAIIAILAAILFPVFAQAKAAAKKTTSISNIKQLATASLIYAGDFDDVFVSQDQSPPNYGWQGSWVMLSLPYMKSYGILKDPSDNVALTTAFNSGPKFTYVANGMLGGTCDSAFKWAFRGVINMNGSNQTWYENGTRSQTQITNVSQTILFASRSSTPKGTDHDAAAGKMEGAFGAWNSVLQGVSSVDIGSQGGTLPGQSTLWSAPVPTYKGYLDTWYGNGSPVVYSDSHAKNTKPEQTVDFAAGTAANNSGGCYGSGFLKEWDALR